MQSLLLFSGKYLTTNLSIYDHKALVRACLNSFFKACLVACRLHRSDQPVDWEGFFQKIAQTSYLDVAVRGEVYNIVDAKTGMIDTHSWYARYLEILETLNNYYRHDVIAAIRQIEVTNSITDITYLTHTEHLLQVLVTYNPLLTHDGAPHAKTA